ncbi:MAG: hypothetical protein RR512_00280 [Coprobacillus sp.]
MKVHKNYLLLLAGLVWGFAGFNVLRIGTMEYDAYLTIVNVLLSIGVFAIFQVMVFSKMVKKHTIRINAYQDKQFFLKFFDTKAFCIMAFMITFGVGLRVSGVCPLIFIAVFYTGLGASLLSAGILFIIQYIKAITKKEMSVASNQDIN